VLTGHRIGIESLVLSPDALWLVSLDFFDTVCFWDMASGTLVNTFKISGAASHIAISPCGTMAACPVGGFLPGKIVLQVWDVVTGESVTFEDVLDVFSSLWSIGRKPHVAFSPDSNLLAMCLDYQVHVWSTKTRKRVLHIRDDETKSSGAGYFDHVSFSPDGSRIQCRAMRPTRSTNLLDDGKETNGSIFQWRTWDSSSGLAVGTKSKGKISAFGDAEQVMLRLGDGQASLAPPLGERHGVPLTFDEVPRVAEVRHANKTDRMGVRLGSCAIVQHEGQLGFLVFDGK
jgi:WD40 repeat protein